MENTPEVDSLEHNQTVEVKFPKWIKGLLNYRAIVTSIIAAGGIAFCSFAYAKFNSIKESIKNANEIAPQFKEFKGKVDEHTKQLNTLELKQEDMSADIKEMHQDMKDGMMNITKLIIELKNK